MKITVPVAARRVGRNPETIRRWIWSGKLPSEKVGTQHLVDERDLERVAGQGSTQSEEERRAAWTAWLADLDDLHARHPELADLPPPEELIRRTREDH